MKTNDVAANGRNNKCYCHQIVCMDTVCVSYA